MKNEKGVTLIALVITVIILSILITAGVTTAYLGMNEIKQNKLQTELGIVRQAVIEQYTAAQAVGKTKKSIDKEEVSFWLGTQVNDSNIILKMIGDLGQYAPMYQEDYYYRLGAEDLEKLGISARLGESKVDSYIVNYSTGEVYNETRELFLPATTYGTKQTEDENSFNDWE